MATTWIGSGKTAAMYMENSVFPLFTVKQILERLGEATEVHECTMTIWGSRQKSHLGTLNLRQITHVELGNEQLKS